MSKVSLLFPINIEGGREGVMTGDFLGSNRLKSAVRSPFAGLSARIISLATWVDAVALRGQVPCQLLFFLIYNLISIRWVDKLGTKGIHASKDLPPTALGSEQWKHVGLWP